MRTLFSIIMRLSAIVFLGSLFSQMFQFGQLTRLLPKRPVVFKVTHVPETLLEQLTYQRAAAEWEHYENQIWQTTTFFMTIIGSLLFFSYLNTDSCFARIAMLLATLAVGFNLRLALVKHRFFSKTRSLALENMELRAYKAGTLPFLIQRATMIKGRDAQEQMELEKAHQICVKPRNWSERQSAALWLMRTITAFLIAVAVLAVLNVSALVAHQWFDHVSWLHHLDIICKH